MKRDIVIKDLLTSELHEITVCVEGSNRPAKVVIIKAVPTDRATEITRQVKDELTKIFSVEPVDLDKLAKMSWPEVEEYEERRQLLAAIKSAYAHEVNRHV